MQEKEAQAKENTHGKTNKNLMGEHGVTLQEQKTTACNKKNLPHKVTQ